MRRRMRSGRDARAGTRGCDAGRGRRDGATRERLGTWSSMRGFAHEAWRALRPETICASFWSHVFAPDSPHRPRAGARGFDSRMSPALDFLAGVGTDHAGRTLDEIAAWNPRQLEQMHDYIQWVFPTMTPGQFNPHAPVLDAAEVDAGARDVRVVRNLRRMAVVMGRFYGLERKEFDDGPQYDPIDDQQRPWWMRADNHNFLRITRMLDSLRLFGLVEEAEALLDVLELLVRGHPGPVSDRTLEFWRGAAIHHESVRVRWLFEDHVRTDVHREQDNAVRWAGSWSRTCSTRAMPRWQGVKPLFRGEGRRPATSRPRTA